MFLTLLSFSLSVNFLKLQNTAQFYRLKPQHDAEQRVVEEMEKTTKLQELEMERTRRTRAMSATSTNKPAPATPVQAARTINRLTASSVESLSIPVNVSRDPEILQLVAEIREEEKKKKNYHRQK